MSVLNRITRDFKNKLKETLEEKRDFYLNSYGLAYKKKLKWSRDDINYETVLTKLDSKLIYICSKAKTAIEEREMEWLKLGVFIDWFHDEKGIYISSLKEFCFSKNDILARYLDYVVSLAESGNCFIEKDIHRKIRFVVYEKPLFDEEEEEEQPRELTEHEQEMLDDYNQQAEQDAADEFATMEREESVNETHQSQNITIYREEKCVTCLESQPNILFCTCGHICMCDSCYARYDKKYFCPFCRTPSIIRKKI